MTSGANEQDRAAVAALRHRLGHVRWIGGAPGGGKSTTARRLAEDHGLELFATDEAMADHASRSAPDQAPFLHAFMDMSMDERWLDRSPEEMLETFHWFRGEGFGLIIEDLLTLPDEPGVVAEGLRLLPSLVEPLLSEPDQAVWLLPTADFRRSAIEGRGETFLDRTSDADRAGRNLAERDRRFTDVLLSELERLDLPYIEVDAAMTEDDTARRVAEALGL